VKSKETVSKTSKPLSKPIDMVHGPQNFKKSNKNQKNQQNQAKIKKIQKIKNSEQQQKDPSRTRPRDVKNQNQIIFNGNPKFLLAISFQPFYISENLTTERHLNHPSFYTDSTLLVQYHVDRLIRINRSFHMQSILILNTSRTCIPHFDSLWTLRFSFACHG
jgi:hypothetical protein